MPEKGKRHHGFDQISNALLDGLGDPVHQPSARSDHFKVYGWAQKTRNAELFKKICSTMAEAGFVRTMEQKQAEQLKKWTRSDQLSVLRDYGRPLGRIPLSQAGQLWVRVRDRDRVRGS